MKIEIQEEVLNAFGDFVGIADSNNLNYSGADVIELIRENKAVTYCETMDFLHNQYGIEE